MKSQNNLKNKNTTKALKLVVIFTLLVIYLLSWVRVNKFDYKGDLQFVDLRVLKILSLNLLKDQPIFWYNKTEFENQLKAELPQIKNLNYKIINSDTLEIEVIAEDICCIITDPNEKSFVVSSKGQILREYDGKYKSNYSFKSKDILNIGDSLDEKLINILKEITLENIKIDDLKENNFIIENEIILFYTKDSKEVIINENTDFKKFNENLKSMKNFLEQNQKNYSMLDFRFEKIIVK